MGDHGTNTDAELLAGVAVGRAAAAFAALYDPWTGTGATVFLNAPLDLLAPSARAGTGA